MLTITKEGNLIKVVETSPSFTRPTEVKTVYYDLQNKKSKVNDDPWYDMTQSAIDWVNKYYVPKLEA